MNRMNPRISSGAIDSIRSQVGRLPRHTWLVTSGVLTLLALGASRRRRLIRKRKVKDVMIRDVVSIAPQATLREAAQTMRDANVGVLPIVEGGITRGLLTDRDLVVRAVADGADPEATLVAECATTDLVCARPDADIDEAMEVMARCQIGRLPVIDEQDRLVGIVTLSSLALRSPDEDEALDTAKAVSRRSARAA
jgi:CBS domain-containing protein